MIEIKLKLPDKEEHKVLVYAQTWDISINETVRRMIEMYGKV